MKKVLSLLLMVCTLVCVASCSEKNGKSEESKYDELVKGFESLELSGTFCKNVKEAVTKFSDLSDDINTCLVNYDTISEADLKALENRCDCDGNEDVYSGHECDFKYDSNKYYRHVKFTYITDYTDEVEEYNFVVSIDANGNVTPEIITHAKDSHVKEYEANAQVILNGLESFVKTIEVKINIMADY